MDKPDVDFIEGLSPAISIDQKSASPQPAVDGRHHHRGLRLPPAAVRPHRRAPLPGVRRPDHPPDAAADRRPHPRAARGHPLPGAGPGRARAARAPTRPCSPTSPPRASPGPGSTARSTSSPTRSTSPATSSTRSRSSSTASCVREGLERRLTDSLETALRLADGVAEVAARRPRRRAAARRRRGRDTLTFSQHLACPNGHGSLRGAGPPQLLVQLALRRLRALRRPRHPLRGRPRAGRAQPRPLARRGRHRPVGRAASSQYFQRLVEAVAEEHGVPTRRAVVEADARSSSKLLLQGTGVEQGARSGTRTATAACAPYTRQLRGRRPVPAAPPHRGRDRHAARADRGLHARGAVPRLRRRPAQARSRWPSPSTATTSPRSATCRSARPPRPSAGLELSERDRIIAERVVKEINARMGFLLDVGLDYLSPVALGGHARRRRGPAHPPGVADRLRPRRRALRARRAVDRPAPARQPPPHRHARSACATSATR